MLHMRLRSFVKQAYGFKAILHLLRDNDIDGPVVDIEVIAQLMVAASGFSNPQATSSW